MTGTPPHTAGLALGLDAGGTRTRWMLASARGEAVAEGTAEGLSAALLATPAGQQRLQQRLAELATQVLAVGPPQQVHAGITGYGGQRDPLAGWIARPLNLCPDAVSLASDVEVAYLGRFKPGEGYLVYAGTGSIGAYIDDEGRFHRVGGRGGLLDDGGSGFWIAREALRQVWRSEDEAPGHWQRSAMARQLLAQVGGADWQHTRQFIAQAERGEMGRLALAVAAAADADPLARQILQQAGRELGRLARILLQRHGARPVVLAGRVWQLHPVIEQACREAIAEGAARVPPIERQAGAGQGHQAAARIAARRLRPGPGPADPPSGHPPGGSA